MDKVQQRRLAALVTPADIAVHAETGFVHRTSWGGRPGLRLEPVGAGRFTLKVCSFRTGGWTEPEIVKVDATEAEVRRALEAYATLPVTRTGFRVWARVVATAVYSG